MSTAIKNPNIVAIEQQRRNEELVRNENRFYAYNQRRIKAGLDPLSTVEFYCRKHGYAEALESAHRAIDAQMIAAAQPEHRDNILLFNR